MTKTSSQHNLPYRFRERAFRIYEPTITSAVNAYPTPITINPRLTFNLSAITFSCRFRDALRSYRDNDWQPTCIDRKRFLQCVDAISVSEVRDTSLLRIGDKDELRRPSIEIERAPARLVQLPDLTDIPVLELKLAPELDLICKLAALRLLANEVKCTGFSTQTKQYYEQQYDVSIEIDPATGIASVI